MVESEVDVFETGHETGHGLDVTDRSLTGGQGPYGVEHQDTEKMVIFPTF